MDQLTNRRDFANEDELSARPVTIVLLESPNFLA